MLHLQILQRKAVLLMINNEIVLKTSEIKQYDNVHQWLKASLKLPEHYGENLDALWDSLTGDMKLPVTILWEDDANTGDSYSSITTIFEEAAGEVDGIEFGYLLDEDE